MFHFACLFCEELLPFDQSLLMISFRQEMTISEKKVDIQNFWQLAM
jgi:hypothetical protein